MDYDEDELAQVIAMADGGMPSKALRCDHCDFTCDANEFWIMFRLVETTFGPTIHHSFKAPPEV